MITCTRCKLGTGCATNNMKGRGRFRGILFFGEAPGREEDQQGKPFVGSAGKILDALIDDSGLRPYGCWITNSCRCRPEANRKPKIHEVRACREHFHRELRTVRPQCIVCLGNTPAVAITDDANASVGKLRGSYRYYEFEGKQIPVMFTFHPAAILYNRQVKDYLVEDFKKLRDWYQVGCPIKDDCSDYTIKSWNELPAQGRIACVDLETQGLDPYKGGRIMSIAAATSSKDVYYTQVNALPGSDKWVEILRRLMGYSAFVFHNALFDCSWMTYRLPQSWFWNKRWEDTLIMLHLRDERYPNTGLGHLAQVHCNITKLPSPDYLKAGFPDGWDTIDAKMILREYNCRDAICTWRLMNALPRKDDAEEACYRWVCSNLQAAVRMRHSGIYLHQGRLEKLHATLTEKIRRLEIKVAKPGVDLHSDDEKREYIYKTLMMPVLRKTPQGKAAMDKETLTALAEKDSTGWIKALLECKGFQKTRDVYCKNMRAWGKIAHPGFYLARTAEQNDEHGANTMRITTQGFSNLPRDGVVKRCMTSRYGKNGLIVEADGSQMEMRIVADLSRDPALMRVFELGQDVHTATAAAVYGVKLEDVEKEQRQNSKKVNFGIVYGMTPVGLARDTGMTKGQAEDFLKEYFLRFPGVKEWIDREHAYAMKHKKVLTPIGREFHLPNALHEHSKDVRKSINSPVQFLANQFTTEALKQTQLWIADSDYKAHVFLTVYDSIESDWKQESWDKVYPSYFRGEVLTRRPKKVMANLGWDIQVPIEWEVKAGPSLGELVEVK